MVDFLGEFEQRVCQECHSLESTGVCFTVKSQVGKGNRNRSGKENAILALSRNYTALSSREKSLFKS